MISSLELDFDLPFSDTYAGLHHASDTLKELGQLERATSRCRPGKATGSLGETSRYESASSLAAESKPSLSNRNEEKVEVEDVSPQDEEDGLVDEAVPVDYRALCSAAVECINARDFLRAAALYNRAVEAMPDGEDPRETSYKAAGCILMSTAEADIQQLYSALSCIESCMVHTRREIEDNKDVEANSDRLLTYSYSHARVLVLLMERTESSDYFMEHYNELKKSVCYVSENDSDDDRKARCINYKLEADGMFWAGQIHTSPLRLSTAL